MVPASFRNRHVSCRRTYALVAQIEHDDAAAFEHALISRDQYCAGFGSISSVCAISSGVGLELQFSRGIEDRATLSASGAR